MSDDFKYIKASYSEVDPNNFDFNKIYEEHFAFIYYIAKDFVHQDVVAEDLAQEVMAKVYFLLEAGDRFNGKNFRAWVRRITANHAKDYLRAKFRRESHIINIVDYKRFYNIEDEDINFDDEDYKFNNALWNYVDGLSKIHSDVIRSVYIDGLSTQEISDKTGIKNNTLKSRKANGINKLKELLGDSRDNINK